MPLVHTEHDFKYKSPLMLEHEKIMYDMKIGESYWEYTPDGLIERKRVSDILWKVFVNRVYVEPVTNQLDRGFSYIG